MPRSEIFAVESTVSGSQSQVSLNCKSPHGGVGGFAASPPFLRSQSLQQMFGKNP